MRLLLSAAFQISVFRQMLLSTLIYTYERKYNFYRNRKNYVRGDFLKINRFFVLFYWHGKAA